MKWFNNMKSGWRITTGFMFLAAFSISIDFMLTSQYRESSPTDRLSLLISLLLSEVLAMGMGSLISRGLGKPVKKLTEDMEIYAKKLTQVEDTFQGLQIELDTMSLKQDSGEKDFFIPAEKFEGVAKGLAQSINDLARRQLGVMGKAMACIDEFANGNYEAELEKFSGENTVINDSIEGLRANVKAFIGEIDLMSKQQNVGNFDVFMSEHRFSGSYEVMAKGINDLVKSHITVILKIMVYLWKFSIGDLDVKIEKFPGKKAFIHQNIEALRKHLSEICIEVNKLVVALEDGDFKEQSNERTFQGDWAKLIKSLNSLSGVMMEPIQEAQTVLKEMSEGNLQTKVLGSYKGEHARLKNALHQTISTLNSYVHELSQVIAEMASGNLNIAILTNYKGDFVEIKNSLNHVIKAFNDVLVDMNQVSEQMLSGSKQALDSEETFAESTAKQASCLDEMTISMKMISTLTQQNATRASQVNELALVAKVDVTQGKAHMEALLRAMSEINESSGHLLKMIKVIDETAFKTDILARSAAFEVEREGQNSSKGLAVIVEDVRNLAAKSAKSAKEMTSLLEDSIKKIEAGNKTTSVAAVALNKLVEGVTKAANLVEEIAAVSQEQAIEIQQVNQGILQVYKIVQTNSASSETRTVAHEELSSQVELLREYVARYKLRKMKGSFYREVEDINPVLSMLEEMSRKKKDNS